MLWRSKVVWATKWCTHGCFSVLDQLLIIAIILGFGSSASCVWRFLFFVSSCGTGKLLIFLKKFIFDTCWNDLFVSPLLLHNQTAETLCDCIATLRFFLPLFWGWGAQSVDLSFSISKKRIEVGKLWGYFSITLFFCMGRLSSPLYDPQIL